jgi:hypothetical protein
MGVWLKTSQRGTTSLEGTNTLPPKCPFFGGSTVVKGKVTPSMIGQITVHAKKRDFTALRVVEVSSVLAENLIQIARSIPEI